MMSDLIRLLEESLPVGSYRMQWLGVDSSGRMTSPGVYFVTLATDRERVVKKVVRLP